VGITHSGNAPLGPNIRRDPLQRHTGNGTGIFSDFRLLNRDDVHNDAALKRVGHTATNSRLGCCLVSVILRRRHVYLFDMKSELKACSYIVDPKARWKIIIRSEE